MKNMDKLEGMYHKRGPNGELDTIIQGAYFWKAEYFKAKLELINANRGLMRLARNKDRYKDTAWACKKAFEKGWIKGLEAAKKIMDAEYL